MASGDLFKRKSLLPTGSGSKEFPARGDEIRRESTDAVFERPTMPPDVPPEVHARRAMRQLDDREQATTARSPAMRRSASDAESPDVERIEPDLDAIEFDLISQNPPRIRETKPGKVPPAGAPAADKQPPVSDLEIDMDASASSALGFVDAHDRGARLPEPIAFAQETDDPPMEKPASLSGLYAVGDFSGALQLAEEMLSKSPDNETARRYASSCREVLTKMCCARIGSLEQTMRVVVAPEKIRWLSIDHRAGFLLSLVDGQSTVEDLLDISGMARLDALRIIAELVSKKVVSLGS